MEKICVICEKGFTPKLKASRQKYCSAECAELALKKAKSERSRTHKKPPIKKVCQICGEEFTARRINQKYCSSKCKHIASKTSDLQSYHAEKSCSSEYNSELRQQQSKIELEEISVVKATEVSDEKMIVRIVRNRLESYDFKTLRQAVNFLSAYSSVDTAECIELLHQHKNKIGSYKIFYD